MSLNKFAFHVAMKNTYLMEYVFTVATNLICIYYYLYLLDWFQKYATVANNIPSS